MPKQASLENIGTTWHSVVLYCLVSNFSGKTYDAIAESEETKVWLYVGGIAGHLDRDFHSVGPSIACGATVSRGGPADSLSVKSQADWPGTSQLPRCARDAAHQYELYT